MENGRVYRHRRLDTNEIFYIGYSDNNKRPYSKYGRSLMWHQITLQTEFEVEIVANNLTEDDALDLEALMINEYGRLDLGTGPLVNKTNGGKGGYGKVYDDEMRKKISQIDRSKASKLVELDGVEYKSIKEAWRMSKYPLGYIRRKTNGEDVSNWQFRK